MSVNMDYTPMIHRIDYILKQKLERRKADGLDYGAPTAPIPNEEEIRCYVEANRRKPNMAHRPSRRRRQNRQRANAASRDVS